MGTDKKGVIMSVRQRDNDSPSVRRPLEEFRRYRCSSVFIRGCPSPLLYSFIPYLP
jgi:hypothetical protein